MAGFAGMAFIRSRELHKELNGDSLLGASTQRLEIFPLYQSGLHCQRVFIGAWRKRVSPYPLHEFVPLDQRELADIFVKIFKLLFFQLLSHCGQRGLPAR